MKANKLDNLSDISNIVVRRDVQGRPLSTLLSDDGDFSNDRKMKFIDVGVVRLTYMVFIFGNRVRFLFLKLLNLKTLS